MKIRWGKLLRRGGKERIRKEVKYMIKIKILEEVGWIERGKKLKKKMLKLRKVIIMWSKMEGIEGKSEMVDEIRRKINIEINVDEDGVKRKIEEYKRLIERLEKRG